MNDFEAAAEEIVEALADEELATYSGGGRSKDIQVVPSQDWQRVEGARGPAVSSRRAEFGVVLSQLPIAPLQGHTLEWKGVTYEIVSVRHDAENTSATLVVKRV